MRETGRLESAKRVRFIGEPLRTQSFAKFASSQAALDFILTIARGPNDDEPNSESAESVTLAQSPAVRALSRIIVARAICNGSRYEAIIQERIFSVFKKRGLCCSIREEALATP